MTDLDQALKAELRPPALDLADKSRRNVQILSQAFLCDMIVLPARPAPARFCSFCGTELDPGARFCKGCGKQAASRIAEEGAGPKPSADTFHSRPAGRRTIYEGYIHKCPGCGEVLEAFAINCPACGYEIRGAKASDSVRELAARLEEIEARDMPALEEKKSVMKWIFGKDFREKDEAAEARRRFDAQKEQEKANLITHYSLPNTKEDMLECMILAASRINTARGIDDAVSGAWISKLEQVYQKAALSMKNDADFARIQEIYERTRQEIRAEKIRMTLKKALSFCAFLIPFLLLLLMAGMEWNPAATLAIAAVISALAAITAILYIDVKK